MTQPSAACCSIPPVVSSGYEAKGEYITVEGTKIYATGPSNAKRALLIIYDIFGFFPQTLQGADILAHSDPDHPYRVYIPDFFDGKPADISWYPPDNKEKEQKLGEFFKTTANPQTTLPRVTKIQQALASQQGGDASQVEAWGIIGFCWGGKIANLSAGEGTQFKAGAACHPAMVDPADAGKLVVPFLMLPSGDEDKEAVGKWESGLKVKGGVEWFPDQIHGWMAARSDLNDEKVKKEYERGYKTLLTFFHENL